MKNDIKLFIEYSDDVFNLWSEAFGDSRDDIAYFLKNCTNKTGLGYFYNSKLVSMLFLVDCSIFGKSGKYIYAACTDKNFKKMGFMSKLLSFAENNFPFIVLIPGNDSLIEFYEKRGFIERIGLECLNFDENESIKEYLLEGCELEKPFLLCYKSTEELEI